MVHQNVELTFDQDQVDEIIKNAIENVVKDNSYDQLKVGDWSGNIIQTIIENLANLQKRFKYVGIHY